MLGSDVVVAVKEAQRLLGDATDADLGNATDGDLGQVLVEAQRLVAMADALTARAMRVFDARAGWSGDDEAGAGSASAWLAWRCRLPRGRARRLVTAGRARVSMPGVAAAFDAGDVGVDQVAALAATRSVDPDAFARDEAMLVEFAGRFRHSELCRILTYWRHRHEPDGAEADAVDRWQARGLHHSTTLDGMGRLDADLDPVSNAVVGGELARLERDAFDADWAEARARLGDAARPADLTRTPAQRRLDALVEMARRSASMDPGARRARPLVTVLVDYPTLAGRVCELSDGTVLTPGELLPLLRDCDLERVVFDGPSRVLDVGARQRLFVGATRRAVEVRDRRCTHPGCDAPAERCEVDHHPVAYEDGGPTIQTNGRLRCPRHHPGRRRHQEGFPTPDE